MVLARVSIDCVGPDTVAVVRRRDGQVQPLLFDGETSLLSGVFVADGGRLIVGREGIDASAVDPQRYVAVPARLMRASSAHDDALADPVDMVAAVLRRVFDQAAQEAGRPVTDAVLVVPAGWGPQRRTHLRNAGYRAGFTTTELVDAGTALAARLFSRDHAATAVADGACVLICRLLGGSVEAVALRRNGFRWDQLATIDSDDLSDLDRAAASSRVVAAATGAMRAADLTASDVAALACQAPASHTAAITGGLREVGITASLRTIADLDVVHGALSLNQGPEQQGRKRWRLAHPAITLAVSIPGAGLLLWLLQQTGLYGPDMGHKLESYERPPYMFTWWPAWAIVAVLALYAGVGATLLGAELRLRRSTQDTDTDRRRYLARGLRVAVVVSLVTALVTAMLGVANYSVIPIWYFLLWTMGSVLIPAAATLLIAMLVRNGYLSAVGWMVWLRLPNTAIALMVVGLITAEFYLYTSASLYSYKFYPGLPDAVAELGAIAIGLAVLPLLIRDLQFQIIASPLVIAAIIWTYSYLNTAVDIAVLLLAVSIWWLVRIRPAPAFSDPTHPAAILAAEYEQAVQNG